MNIPVRPQLVTERARAYAEETGREPYDVYIRLLAVIGTTHPEIIDQAFADLRATEPYFRRTEPDSAHG